MAILDRRTVVNSVFAIGLLLPVLASEASAQQWADNMFSVKEHDFRIVGRGTKNEFHFEFTNLYEEDLHVQAVRTSCGCTTPTLTKQSLKTYEKGAVVATFNTNAFIGENSLSFCDRK